jgi:hypothetical protein
MELEELTTTQIILLVLLVSFVTSIATGIVTVSLLAQAPPAVTQTVNHIIERTVQTVAPDLGAPTVTKETTVVVKEDDLVTKSVADSLARIGRIHADASTTSPVVAIGAVTANGILVTDASAVEDVRAVTLGGTDFLYQVSRTLPDVGIALMVATGTSPSITALKTADAGSLKLGQTVIGLYGIAEDRIGMTTIAGESKLASVKAGDTSVPVRTIDTGFSTPTPGTPLVTVFGDLVGISTSVSRASDKGAYVAMSDLAAALMGQVKGDATSTAPTP